MLTCMNILRWLIEHLLVIALTMALLGQHALHAQLSGAYEQYARGDPRGAIAVLKPLVEGASDEPGGVERGIAWNLLGSAYQSVEEFQEARRCYENSLRILREVANARLEYASALADMAALEITVGNVHAAKKLDIKSKQLYEAEEYHSGLALVENNLALIALREKNVRGARREINEAFRQAELAGTLKDDDYAPMYVVKGSVTDAEGDPRGAIAAYNKAVELWTRGHGANYYLVGMGFAMRGSAYSKIGDATKAIADLKLSLSLLEQMPGRNSTAYYRVEMSYAKALRGSGQKQEAAQLDREARDGMAALSRQQCNGCTISAEGFR